MSKNQKTLPAENPKKREKTFENSKKESRDAAGAAALEVAARAETPDILNGMTGEKLSEKNESGGQRKSEPAAATKKSQKSQKSAAGLKKMVFPEPRVLARKIKTEIKTEISEIEKSVKKLEKSPIKNAKKLADAVALLRKMRAFLAEIAHKTFDALKKLWIEISAGKKIADILPDAF